ncbi:hypothetical protein Raf01_60130 [Rugosimonospora africana]|uniref:Uncharacterized protein n=1 Tax=Rugosimonospora africana TaxID=556532 RepID=A0A8J3R082_9ACTN|nr:hypothetical protein Raf01_60130 [Rugosimonospora africana]
MLRQSKQTATVAGPGRDRSVGRDPNAGVDPGAGRDRGVVTPPDRPVGTPRLTGDEGAGDGEGHRHRHGKLIVTVPPEERSQR